MTDAISFSDAQFQKILTTLESLKSAGGVHWEQIIPVFLSAALGMSVGIGLEYFKSYCEKSKLLLERQKKDQINIATIGIGYNIEILTHLVFQNILPHHAQSNSAYSGLQATGGDGAKITSFAYNLGQYPALMMSCPEIYFVEHDFLERLPFIVEKDPELLKQASWLVSLLRTLKNAIMDRNKYIETGRDTAARGGLNFYQLDSILQLQKSISDAECVTALQLFENFLLIAQSLENISKGYKIPGKRTKLVPPAPVSEAITKLREIAAGAIQKMPEH